MNIAPPSAPASSPPHPRVRDMPVLTGGARRAWQGLTAGLAVVSVALAGWWLTLPGRWNWPTSYSIISLALGVSLALWWARWLPLGRMRRPVPMEPAEGLRVAVVTTVVPAREPLEMLAQSLAAMVALDYPHDTWVLDEGDDPAVRALCARLGARHFSRQGRPALQQPSGPYARATKYGNLNAWLTTEAAGHYEIVATFDPDHVPERDFLARTLGYFADPGVGYVQSPQVYYNQPASFIARGAAEETYAYYSSHQMASYALGHPIVVGSHGVHRLAALEEVGLFPAHDAEDLYLTMRYRGAGWRGVYVPEILALGTTPVDWRGYLGQQARWARSVLDLKRQALRRSVGTLSATDRVLSLFHGAHYLRALLWLPMLTLLQGLLASGVVPGFFSVRTCLVVAGSAALFQGAGFFRQRFYLDPAGERGYHWRAALLQYAKWPFMVGALLDTVLRREVPYKLTPKVAGGTARRILGPVHVMLAGTVAVAWGVGVLRNGGLAPGVEGAALLVIGASLALAASEQRRFPPPYDPTLLETRRRQIRFRRAPSGP